MTQSLLKVWDIGAIKYKILNKWAYYIPGDSRNDAEVKIKIKKGI